MAKRKQLFHPDEVRKKIQVSQLINRLTANALSDEEIMTPSQVNSAKILIGKAVPDIKAVEHLGGIDLDLNLRVKSDAARFTSAIAGLATRSAEE